MVIASYVARFIFRLFVRRIVARVIDGDPRPLIGRAKGNQNGIGGGSALSHARQFLAKTDFAPVIEAVRQDLGYNPDNRAYTPSLDRSTPLWTDSRPNHQRGIVSSMAVMPVDSTLATTMRINGQFMIGKINKQVAIYTGVEHTLGRPLAHNDARDYRSNVG